MQRSARSCDSEVGVSADEIYGETVAGKICRRGKGITEGNKTRDGGVDVSVDWESARTNAADSTGVVVVSCSSCKSCKSCKNDLASLGPRSQFHRIHMIYQDEQDFFGKAPLRLCVKLLLIY